jgi:hypothetical protein
MLYYILKERLLQIETELLSRRVRGEAGELERCDAGAGSEAILQAGVRADTGSRLLAGISREAGALARGEVGPLERDPGALERGVVALEREAGALERGEVVALKAGALERGEVVALERGVIALEQEGGALEREACVLKRGEVVALEREGGALEREAGALERGEVVALERGALERGQVIAHEREPGALERGEVVTLEREAGLLEQESGELKRGEVVAVERGDVVSGDAGARSLSGIAREAGVLERAEVCGREAGALERAEVCAREAGSLDALEGAKACAPLGGDAGASTLERGEEARLREVEGAGVGGKAGALVSREVEALVGEDTGALNGGELVGGDVEFLSRGEVGGRPGRMYQGVISLPEVDRMVCTYEGRHGMRHSGIPVGRNNPENHRRSRPTKQQKEPLTKTPALAPTEPTEPTNEPQTRGRFFSKNLHIVN